MGLVRTHLTSRGSGNDSTPSLTSPYAPIDPITNRRIPTYTERKTTLAKALKASFLSTPVHSDGPPSAQELRKYRQVEIDDQPWVTVQLRSNKYSDLNEYKPVLSSSAPANASTAQTYDDLHKYKPLVDQVDTAHDVEPKHNGLHKYGPVDVHNSASSAPAPTKGTQKYNDLHKYVPVAWREPNGEAPPSSEEKSKHYSDLDKYHPISFNEPNGNLPPSAEESLKD
ncbi:hypothetical protein HYQ44_020227 [Verticillium longisporum]|nr:hypothetical protein HYQ44_020227 [Verticillium longisporum]